MGNVNAQSALLGQLNRIQDNDPSLTRFVLEERFCREGCSPTPIYDGSSHRHVTLWEYYSLSLFRALANYPNHVQELDLINWNLSYSYRSSTYRPFLELLPCMNSLRKIIMPVLDRHRDIRFLFQAIQQHGQLERLEVTFVVWGFEGRTLSFEPRMFAGLKELRISLHLYDFEEIDELRATAASSIESLSSALSGNPTIRKLTLVMVGMLPLETLRVFTRTLLTMSSLETLGVGYKGPPSLYRQHEEPVGDNHVELVLEAIQRSGRITRVFWASCPELNDAIDVDPYLVSAVIFYCEQNRIGFQALLEADELSIPLALWPHVLAKTQHADNIFALLCEKHDSLIPTSRE